MSDPEYYKILQVSKKASVSEIKIAYRRLAKKYHPDVNPNDKKAESQFKKINEAYEVLKNSAKRAEYDNLLKCREDEQQRKATTQNYKKSVKTAENKARQQRSLKVILWQKIFLLLIFCGYIGVLYYNSDVNQPFNFYKAFSNTGAKMNNAITDSGKIIVEFYQNDEWLTTAWRYVTEFNDVKLAKRLLEYRSTCQIFDDKGHNLLMKTSNVEIAKALIEAGCDVNYKAPDGETALSLAIKNNNEELSELLRKKGANFPWKHVLP